MIRPITDFNVESLVACWNACYPPEFQIDADTFSQLQTGSPDYLPQHSIALVGDNGTLLGFALAKQTPRTRHPHPPFDFGQPLGTTHLSALAFQTARAGREVLNLFLTNHPETPIVFGQEQRHLLPGAPEHFPELIELLREAGFTESPTLALDFGHDLAAYLPPADLNEQAECRYLQPGEEPLLAEFFEREFPGRWRSDMMEKVAIEGPRAIFTLWLDGQLHGFSCLQDASHKLKIAGATFHLNYGENWCALGPIGVSAGLRGQRLGDTLLAKSLLELKSQGKRICVIDWTTLERYYGKHGFIARRKYHLFNRPISSG